MKVKGVFRLADYFDEWAFRAWFEKHNPNGFIVDGLKIPVSRKIGKRRRLKKMTLRVILDYPPCTCCQPSQRLVLE